MTQNVPDVFAPGRGKGEPCVLVIGAVATSPYEPCIPPSTRQIVCVGTPRGVLTAQTEAEETNVLTAAWREISASGGRVVTWDGRERLRLLVWRSLRLRVDIPVPPSVVQEWTRPAGGPHHVDCAELLRLNDPYAEIRMATWAAWMGLDASPSTLEGVVLAEMVERGEWSKIAAACSSDVSTLLAIYGSTIRPCFGR